MAMERIIEYQADINGKEVKYPRDFLSYDNIDKFVIDIKDIDVDLSTARDVIVLFVCYSYDKQKHTQISCELDQENKKISFKLPENLREHQGLVKASVYIDFTNEDRLELITISFKIKKSLIDQNITEVVDYYYETFNKRTEEMTNELNKVGKRITELTNVMLEKIDGNVEEIERIRDENLDRLKNIKYDIDNFVAQKTNDVTTKTNDFLTFVNGKMQTVTSAYDNIDDFIENKNQEFATYADSKKSSINGYLTEFNTYIDSQKSGFKGVVDEQSSLVQQATSDFRKNLNKEKVSFSDDINAIHDYYENQMNTVKEAFANAQTLLDPIIEEERKKLEDALMGSDSIVGEKISEFNTYVDEKKSEVDEKISSISVEIPQVQEVLTDIENRLNVLQDDVGVNLFQNAVEFPIATSSDYYSGRWRYAGSPRTARTHVYITDPPAELPYEKYGAYQITGIHPPYQSDTECISLDQTIFIPSMKYVVSCWARIVQGSEAYVGFAGAINFVGGFEKALNGYRSTRLNSDGSWTKCYALIENTGTANLYIGVLTGTDTTVVQVIHPYLAYRNPLRERKMYPINFVFETISIENPNVTLGGTWEKLGEEQKFGRTVFYWRRIS